MFEQSLKFNVLSVETGNKAQCNKTLYTSTVRHGGYQALEVSARLESTINTG